MRQRMNRHQVLTGAVNAGENCYAVGGVDGVPFVAYAAGCNIVILASSFQRVEIIPGVRHDNVQVSCLDCSADFGKIAASYGKRICVFEPTPLLHKSSSHRLDYKWVQTATLTADCSTMVISWNSEGSQLLTGGDCIQIWVLVSKHSDSMQDDVKFQIGKENESKRTPEIEEPATWECIWKCRTSNPVSFLKFSPDGTMFASAGKIDRLAKIWYENKKVNFVSQSGQSTNGEASYTFIYIAHPRAITSLSWRKTSKYMPRNSVANMLITSCRDNICRLWVQTLLPEDGLVNIQQIEALASQAPHLQTQRHRQRIMQRLKHMKSFNQYKKRQATQFVEDPHETVPILPSTYSVHDFHNFSVQGVAVAPGMHFHLAASINAATDIPLVPNISNSKGSRELSFVLHWLNNKEVVFSEMTEQLLRILSQKVLQSEAAATNSDPSDSDYQDQDSQRDGSQQHLHPTAKKGMARDPTSQDHLDDDASSKHSFSAVSSSISLAADAGAFSQMQAPLIDALDRKIDSLLREWHSSPDLLFSVHPVDGSFLVWLVDWLDECFPGSFRQAQVSFCSRIPNAFPLGDASTMSESLVLYSPQAGLELRMALQGSAAINGKLDKTYVENILQEASESARKVETADGQVLLPENNLQQKSYVSPTPILCMLSKHSNGSLNLWHLTFGDNAKYTHVLSISHFSRVCGHRFRINDITCHPVLPLLLTTSHHNLPGKIPSSAATSTPSTPNFQQNVPNFGQSSEASGFCSELILWKVDSVGPLSKSGGVTELARINSLETAAFSNVAWIPTLLPSTTLGSISNSPSACFVASDGQKLRIYQAVIDARTILAEVSFSTMKNLNFDLSLSSSTSSGLGYRHQSLEDSFHIVSSQSTARPGCILELNAISDASHDWQNTQLLHVFQEQMITGKRMKIDEDVEKISLVEPGLQAVVDLRNASVFEEPFYLVVLEKTEQGQSSLHMWKILFASHPGEVAESSFSYVPDSNLVQDSDHSNHSSRSNTPEPQVPNVSHASPLHITTSKVCTQILPLPEDVEIIHADPAAGHLSSSSIYPACFAPYLICTACSDGVVRLWHCKQTYDNGNIEFEWVEWTMMLNNQPSSIDVPGQPLFVSCSYSGRLACAYKYGRSYTKPTSEDVNERFVNISVSIFECESTGGSEWILEDTIHLKNVVLPKSNVLEDLDLNSLYDTSLRNKRTVDAILHKLSPNEAVVSEHRPSIQKLLSVPSYTTLHTLRQIIAQQGNQCLLTQKSLVQLDWVSTEDGSHVLTVAVGSKIMLFTPVSTDIAQSNVQTLKAYKSVGRPLLKQASSMAPALLHPEEMRWMCLRTTYLSTADGLPPLPMQLSWVRDGILVVGMDSEMHIYSQWRSCQLDMDAAEKKPETGAKDIRSLKEQELLTRAQEASQLRLPVGGTSSITRNLSCSLISSSTESRKKKETSQPPDSMDNLDALPDFGLFEASRIACPVLPQYHPKQLMELLQFGKISRVKAILSHIVRCLAGMENFKKSYEHFLESTESGDHEESGGRSWSRSRALSIAAALSPNPNSPMDNQGSVSVFPEEIQLDYVEITSIPPLPLFTLLAADSGSSSGGRTQGNENASTQDYTGLFDLGGTSLPDSYVEFSSQTKSKLEKGMSFSSDKTEITKFGPRQVRLLTQLLTHTHLPGLSSLDQMHLLALADTIATCSKTRFETVGSQTKTQHLSADRDTATELTVTIDSLDNCGLRYLLAMRHHTYLMCCLPLAQRAQLQKLGLTTNSLVWAFHSETPEELLQLIPAIQKGNPRWNDLRELGIGWWLRNNGTLRHVMEKVAKAAFQSNNNPLDAALYYLAMKKKSLVWGLFRSVSDHKMTTFFQNNFTDDRWRKAALKNAFALLGKQRFEHAAAFFLLAGALRDAVEVCLHKLDDLQLAMVLVRLHEGDLETTTSNLRRLLYEEILGYDVEGSFYTPSKAHPDPFLRSIALWTLQDYSGALTTLLQTDIGHAHPKIASDDMKKMSEDLSANPSVFNFYLYLRTHPLVVRSNIFQSSQAKKSAKSFLLLGLKPNSPESSPSDAWLARDDSITPLERRLFFTTAHAHFHAGCPALALEVLCRLPNRIIQPHTSEEPTTENSSSYDLQSKSKDQSFNQPVGIKINKAEEFDWSQPSATEKSMDFDWGQPVISQKAGEFDWSQPLSSQKAEDFAWSQSQACESEASSDDEGGGIQLKTVEDNENVANDVQESKTEATIDVMAQQLKFIACLKIMMEELSTLATGFEVDGGQLRYHLYIWLERSVAALCDLCHYGQEATSMGTGVDDMHKDRSGTCPQTGQEGSSDDYPTLHEILIADTLDFEAKLHRATRRKKWLKSNETLLRTLLSYCGLHGAHGGGLAAVRMELMLLLQELQQDRSQHQLLSPLPFPTTLPLLAASVACQKTVVTDPIRFLQSVTHDILQTVVELNSPPSVLSTSYTQVSILRDLSTALSACIYQSLCDSDNFIVKQSNVGPQAVEDFISSSVVYHNSHLLAGHRSQRNNSGEEPVRASTAPSKWPGVQSLRALLARDKDEDSPKLHTLLCESFVAAYLSQLIHGLVTYDCHVLYRLVSQTFTEQTWAMLFGGGAKRLLRVSTAVSPVLQPTADSNKPEPGEAGLLNTLSKQRMKLHMKILAQLGQGAQQPTIKEDRPTYREQFIPPEMSLVSCFMSKPILPNEWLELDYDSSESLPSSDEEDDDKEDGEDDDAFMSEDKNLRRGTTSVMEQLDPLSYSWAILRLCIVKLAKYYLLSFLDVAGIELPELPVSSPWIHAILKVLEQWLKRLKEVMDDFGKPPANYLPNCFVNNAQSGPPILKYKALLDFGNTPFRSHHALSMPAKRLWNYLVRQELVQDIFIRYIFSRKHPHVQNADDSGDLELDNPDVTSANPVRIIHKDQDSITAFCINKASAELMSIATPKEIQELDISLLLEPSPWMEDEAELDILNIQRSSENLTSSDYIVVQHPLDRMMSTNGPSSSGVPTSASGSTYGSPTGPAPPLIGTQTGRASTMLRKHRCDGVRRMCAHPFLPLYLTGSQDGSVKMWEWGHQHPVSEPRPRGTFAKVTKVLFNSQGNKFGVTDGDGNLSLWQVGLSSVSTAPFFSKQCHSKQASDFDFVSSSSLLATAGQSSDGKNVCLFDTLLPSRKAQVSAFHCHETGSSALAYAARNQVIISAGKKGDICIFDIRQRQLRQMFQAHEHPIKCLALDPGEEFFVTGSADGDIKVWGLSYHVLLYSFPGEHSRSTLFRNIGMGVSQMLVDSSGRVFSCGADGSLKFRQLPERDLIVKSLV